jgi:hypothetical protein
MIRAGWDPAATLERDEQSAKLALIRAHRNMISEMYQYGPEELLREGQRSKVDQYLE